MSVYTKSLWDSFKIKLKWYGFKVKLQWYSIDDRMKDC